MEGLWDRRIGADGLVREPSVYLRLLPAVTVLRFKATAIAQRRGLLAAEDLWELQEGR
jgi:hypothetical protein